MYLFYKNRKNLDKDAAQHPPMLNFLHVLVQAKTIRRWNKVGKMSAMILASKDEDAWYCNAFISHNIGIIITLPTKTMWTDETRSGTESNIYGENSVAQTCYLVPNEFLVLFLPKVLW